MKYSYSFLAIALCSMLPCVTLAGVTDLSNGNVENQTNVSEHYSTTEGSKCFERVSKDGGMVNLDQGSSGSVRANVTVKNNQGNGVWSTFTYTAENASDLGQVIIDDYKKNGLGDNRSVIVWNGEVETSRGVKGDYAGTLQVGGTYSTEQYYTDGAYRAASNLTKRETSVNDQWDETTYETVTSEEWTPYTLTSRKTSFVGVNYSEGFLQVGDPDDVFNSYVVNGTATYNYQQDDYYSREHCYKDTEVATTTHYTQPTANYEVNLTITYSPIVLDLDGDGKIEASNGQYLAHRGDMQGKIAIFDLFGNNYPVITEWVGKNDGLLCHPNADGTVNGSNLFGNLCGFADGYEQMAAYDDNDDETLSGAELKDLRVWIDTNGDAVAQSNELKTLAELGITSLSVKHKDYKSTFVRYGQTYNTFDWWPTYRDMRKVDLASK